MEEKCLVFIVNITFKSPLPKNKNSLGFKMALKIVLDNFQSKACAYINLVLVLHQLLFILCSDGYYLDNSSYQQKKILGLGYTVEWWVNFKEKAITFEVSAKTSGYVGFGLSRSGGMVGSDIIIGGVGANGKPYFEDAHVQANRSVQIDQQQDWELLAAWEKGGSTYLTIKRPFDTCDPDDIAITKDLIFLIWAYGGTDDVEYHMKRRGSAPFYILDPMIADEIAQAHYRQIGPHSNLYLVQRFLVSNLVKLEPKPTSILCNIQRGPTLLARHDIVGMGAYLPTKLARKHVQQFRVFKCMAPQHIADSKSFTNENNTVECFLNLPPFCRELIYVWGRGGKPFYFPDDIGISIGLSQNEYFLLETTYDNSDNARNMEIEAGVEIVFSHRQKPHSASLIQVGYGAFGTFFIPPKATLNIHGSCGPTCTSSMFPKKGVRAFAAMLQTRSLGRTVHLQHFRGNQELKYILSDDNYHWEFGQQMRLLKENILLLPGDQITTHCFYNSWERNHTSFSGFSTQDEICTGYIFISTKIPFFQCTSELNPEKQLAPFGVNGVTWDLKWQERFVTEPQELEGTWLGDVIDHKSHSKTRNAEKLQADYYFNPHMQSCPSIFETMVGQEDSGGPFGKETRYLSSQVSYPRNVKEYQDDPTCLPTHRSSVPASSEPHHPVPKTLPPTRRPFHSIPESADPHSISNKIVKPNRQPSHKKFPSIPESADPHSVTVGLRRIPSTRKPSIPESPPHADERRKPHNLSLILKESLYPKSIEDLSTDVFQQLFLQSLEEGLFRAAQQQNRDPSKNDDPLFRDQEYEIRVSEEDNQSQPRLKSQLKKKEQPKRIHNRPSYHRSIKNQFDDPRHQPATPFPTLQSFEDQFYRDDEHFTSEKPTLSEEFFSFPASKPTSKPMDLAKSMRTRKPKVVQNFDQDSFLKPTGTLIQAISDQHRPYTSPVLRSSPGPHEFKENRREQFPNSRVEKPRINGNEQPTVPTPSLKEHQHLEPYKPQVLKRPVFDFEIPEQPLKAFGGPTIPKIEEQHHQQPGNPYTPKVQKRPNPTFDEYELSPIKASLQRLPPLSTAFKGPTLNVQQQPDEPYIHHSKKRPAPTFDEFELPSLEAFPERPLSSPFPLQRQQQDRPTLPRLHLEDNDPFEIPLFPTLTEQQPFKEQGQRRPIRILEEAKRLQQKPHLSYQPQPVSFFDEIIYKTTTEKPKTLSTAAYPHQNYLERPSSSEFIDQSLKSKRYKPTSLKRPSYLPEDDLHSNETPPTSTPITPSPRGLSVSIFDEFPPSKRIHEPTQPPATADLPYKNKPIIKRPTVPKLEEDSYLTEPERPKILSSYDNHTPFNKNVRPTSVLPGFHHDVKTKTPLRRPQHTLESSEEQPPPRSKTHKINSEPKTGRPTTLPPSHSIGNERSPKHLTKRPQTVVDYSKKPIYRNPVRNPLVTPPDNNDDHYDLDPIPTQKPKSVLTYLNDVENDDKRFNPEVFYHKFPIENKNERESYHMAKNAPTKSSKINYSDNTRHPPQQPKRAETFDEPNLLKRPIFQYSNIDDLRQLQRPEPKPSPPIKNSEPDGNRDEVVGNTHGRVLLNRPSFSEKPTADTTSSKLTHHPSYQSDTSEDILSKKQQKVQKKIPNKKDDIIPKMSKRPIFHSLIPTIPPITQLSHKQEFDLKTFLTNSIFNSQAEITIPFPLVIKDNGTKKDNKSILNFFEQLANIFSPGTNNKEQAKEILKTLESANYGVSAQRTVQNLSKRRGYYGDVELKLKQPPPKKKTTKKPTTGNIKLIIVHNTDED